MRTYRRSSETQTRCSLLLLIDNYDSFVHNLARYCRELGCETRVIRNDELSAEAALELSPEAIIVSPGPCTPAEAGISEELIRLAVGRVPLLGVCLGHQAICSAESGFVIRASRPIHGQTSRVEHDGSTLFEGLPNPLRVMRYHSLIVDEQTLPEDYFVTARTKGGIPMAIQHKSQPVFGVQFHPESILTECGHKLLANFLRAAGVPIVERQANELTANIDQSLWEQPFEHPEAQGL